MTAVHPPSPALARRMGNQSVQAWFNRHHAAVEPTQRSVRPERGATTRPSRAPLVARQPAPAGQRAPSARFPERFPTYEGWLEAFYRSFLQTPAQRQANTFSAQGQTVLGGGARPRQSAAEAGRFIDRPTEEWLQHNLPDRLRQLAYVLPCDCADIAIVLRHVWLAAHGRSQRIGRWTIGEAASRRGLSSERRAVGSAISGLGSGNVSGLINPYMDASGQPLREFAVLKHMLHPGDILIWEHHRQPPHTQRSGGHVQTITHVTRVNGQVTEIFSLQGNQPLANDDTPARRIEVSRDVAPGVQGTPMQHSDLVDRELPAPLQSRSLQRAWTWTDGHTRLVAAGPPASVRRPQGQRGRGRGRVRRLADWLPILGRSRDTNDVLLNLEAAALETRAAGEASGRGATATSEDAASVGRAAGERLWRLATRAANRGRRDALGDVSHFAPLQQGLVLLRALTAASTNSAGRSLMTSLTESFELAARGATTIRSTGGGRRAVHVLVTGFDPFRASGTPAAGEWNPAGAAALDLDGERLSLAGGRQAFVESVVLPVDRAAFDAGIVERIVGPLVRGPRAAVDAVISVGMDPNLTEPLRDPLHIERYAVNVFENARGALQPIEGAGPPIIETPIATGDVASGARAGGRQGGSVEVDTDLTLRFATAREANRLRQRLGVSASPSTIVTVRGAQAERVASSARRGVGPPGAMSFIFTGERFHARVEQGPAGNYYCNEAMYRVLNLPGHPQSFFVHTPGGPAVTASNVRIALQVRNRIVGALRAVVRAAAGVLVGRR